MTNETQENLTEFAKDYRKSTQIIMKFLQDLTNEQNPASLEHNAKTLIARLAAENMLIETIER